MLIFYYVAISAPKSNDIFIGGRYGIRMRLSWAWSVIKRLGLDLRLRLDNLENVLRKLHSHVGRFAFLQEWGLPRRNQEIQNVGHFVPHPWMQKFLIRTPSKSQKLTSGVHMHDEEDLTIRLFICQKRRITQPLKEGANYSAPKTSENFWHQGRRSLCQKCEFSGTKVPPM